MKFTELERRMRVYETAHDHSVLPGIFIVARIDGRSFSRLTRDVLELSAPYDEPFRDHMVDTCRHLMECGFAVVYAYTQSDEMSLLLHRRDQTFGRRLRKLHSVLAGEASAYLSRALSQHATFDCRISQLPTERDVVDYFRWRQEDAHRNALNGHCYWVLRSQGKTEHEATVALNGLSVGGRNELLYQNGIPFNEVPLWERRGVGLYWEQVEKAGENPKTGEPVVTLRRRIKTDLELPMKSAYEDFVRDLVRVASGEDA